MSRNSQFGSWAGGVWNMVFTGCVGAPGSHCGNQGGAPITNTGPTPLIAEKPYITEAGDHYTLNIPRVERNKNGLTAGW